MLNFNSKKTWLSAGLKLCELIIKLIQKVSIELGAEAVLTLCSHHDGG